MAKIEFTSNSAPTVGVEIELALVDNDTGALTSSIGELLKNIPPEFQATIKPELMQCYVEVNSKVCSNIDEAEVDLRTKLRAMQAAADPLNVGLFWTGTHPFSLWKDQTPSPGERYAKLLDLLQDLGRQLITYGLHVHVGVDTGDKAVTICDRILKHLPVLLALSCNSPWWENRITGLKSHRSKIMEMLPTAGLPPQMSNWSEYVWLVNHLTKTRFMNSIRELWWDVRPHNNFGTVEIRICDTPGSLDDALAIAALVQCLVVSLSREIDEGTYQHDAHPMMIRQNKWRAARYGLDADIVDGITLECKTARERTRDLIEQLGATAQQLGCSRWLEHLNQMSKNTTAADRQLESHRSGMSLAELVQQKVTEARL
jgi:glutamate---cysteine ligase / carboxylate-amine ligase